MKYTRENTMKILAEKYFYFLKYLPFEDKDELYLKGMGEAQGKFLANMHIIITKEMLPKKFNDRHYSTDYVSPAALVVLKLNGSSLKDLRYEHIVPKTKYVKNICEDLAIKGTLTEDFVYDLLLKYFWTATITDQEDKLLKRTSMPENWDTVNIFARYEEKNITLIPHDKSYFMLKWQQR